MSNDYFNNGTPVARNTLARAEAVNANFDAVVAGFDELPGKLELRQNRHTYVTASGSANALTVTLSPVPAAYVEGMHLAVKIGTTNTGAATINVNSLGVKSIKRIAGDALIADDLQAGGIVEFRYDGTAFRVVSTQYGDVVRAETAAGTATTQASAASTSAASAATQATNAASSASAAATSATAAATSATNAASSASSASTSATNAASSASSASTSASSASTSATNAASSASSASTSATNAASSATTASTGASTATTQASNASTSATNAASSATAAAASATSAASSAASAAASATSAAGYVVPSQTGHSGEFLTTNGTATSWGAIPAASATVSGIVELATNAEAQTGTDAVRAVTPAALASVTATDTRAGLVELATTAEAQTGTDTTRAVTPAGVKAVADTKASLSATQTFTAAQRGTVSALTDGATITPDFSAANLFSVTLGGNRTLANPSNLTAGQEGCIFITQDGTGSRTLSYGTYWDFAGGTAPTLSTAASSVDRLDYVVRSSTSIHANLTKAFS